jgi:hypothetical protein
MLAFRRARRSGEAARIIEYKAPAAAEEQG